MTRDLLLRLLVFAIISHLHAYTIRNIEDDDEYPSSYSVRYVDDVPRSRQRYYRLRTPDFDEDSDIDDDDDMKREIRSTILQRMVANGMRGSNADHRFNVGLNERRLIRRQRRRSQYYSPNVYRQYIDDDLDQWMDKRNDYEEDGASDSNARWKRIVIKPNTQDIDEDSIRPIWKTSDERPVRNYWWNSKGARNRYTGNIDTEHLLPQNDEIVSIIPDTDSNDVNLDDIDLNTVTEGQNNDDSNFAVISKYINGGVVNTNKMDAKTLIGLSKNSVLNNRWKILKIDADDIDSGKVDMNTLVKPDKGETISIHKWNPIKPLPHSGRMNMTHLLQPSNVEVVKTKVLKPPTVDLDHVDSDHDLTEEDIKILTIAIKHNWKNLGQDAYQVFKNYWLKIMVMLQNLHGDDQDDQRQYLLWLLKAMKTSIINNPEFANMHLKFWKIPDSKLTPNIDSGSQVTDDEPNGNGPLILINKNKPTHVKIPDQDIKYFPIDISSINDENVQISTTEIVPTMPPNSELIKKICEGVNQNLEDFWKIFYTYFGKKPNGKENLQELEKLYLILTIFTQFTKLQNVGLPVDRYVDQIIKIVSPDLQALGPILTLNKTPRNPNIGCVDCDGNKIKHIIHDLIDKDKTLNTKIPDQVIENVPDDIPINYDENGEINKPEIDTEPEISKPDIQVDSDIVNPIPDIYNPEDENVEPLPDIEEIFNNLKPEQPHNTGKPVDHDVNVPSDIPLIVDLDIKTIKPVIYPNNQEGKTPKPVSDLDNVKPTTDKLVTDSDHLVTYTVTPEPDLNNQLSSIKTPVIDQIQNVIDHLEGSTQKPDININSLKTTATGKDLDHTVTENPISNVDSSSTESLKPQPDTDNVETQRPKADSDNVNPETTDIVPDLNDKDEDVVEPTTDNVKDVDPNPTKPVMVPDNLEGKTIKPTTILDPSKAVTSADNVVTKTVTSDVDDSFKIVTPTTDLDKTITMKPSPVVVTEISTETPSNGVPDNGGKIYVVDGPKDMKPDTTDDDILNGPLNDHTLKAKFISLKKYYPKLSDDEIMKKLLNEIRAKHLKPIINDEDGTKIIMHPGDLNIRDLIAKNPVLAKFLELIDNKAIPDNEYDVQPNYTNKSNLPEIESQILSKDIPSNKVNIPAINKDNQGKPGTIQINPNNIMNGPNQSNGTGIIPTFDLVSKHLNPIDLFSNETIEFIAHFLVAYLKNLIKDHGLDIFIGNLDFNMIARFLSQILIMIVKTLTTNGISMNIIMKVVLEIQGKLRLFQSAELQVCLLKIWTVVADIIATIVTSVKLNLSQ